jgi:hypothetical protein
MPQKIDAEKCPQCHSRNLAESSSHPGFYACRDCGKDPLARLRREGIFGEQFYYVDPARPGMRTHSYGSGEIKEGKEV